MRQSYGSVGAHGIEVVPIEQMVELITAKCNGISTEPVRPVKALFVQALVIATRIRFDARLVV